MEVDLNSESSDTINKGGIYQFWIHYGGYNESTGTAFLIMPDCPTGQYLKKIAPSTPTNPWEFFSIVLKLDQNVMLIILFYSRRN
jgi:hypothetical protein